MTVSRLVPTNMGAVATPTTRAAAILLVNPKTPFNVGATIRAASTFGATEVRWTGDRISEAEWRRDMQGSKAHKDRLPREERLKDYSHITWGEWPSPDVVGGEILQRFKNKPVDFYRAIGYIPVAVDFIDNAEWLTSFDHPKRALYVFGPEDGTLGGGWLSVCHRFVRIPSATRTPLNLAMVVNIVLYDRFVKMGGAR